MVDLPKGMEYSSFSDFTVALNSPFNYIFCLFHLTNDFYPHQFPLGIVLGSFYYGYAFLQLPGGCLALKLGGTRIFGYAIFLASMLTLLTPVATRYSVYGLIAVRAGEGLMLVGYENRQLSIHITFCELS